MTYRNGDNPLVYFTDCLMATADSLAMLSTPPKKEVARQLTIIQKCINTITSLGIENTKSRPKKAINEFGGDAVAWIRRYNADIPQVTVTDAAGSEQEMISEIREFIKETIAAPSSKLAKQYEMHRHNLILTDLNAHLPREPETEAGMTM